MAFRVIWSLKAMSFSVNVEEATKGLDAWKEGGGEGVNRKVEVWKASDEYELMVRRWVPGSPPSNSSPVIFIAHGMAEHCARYDELACSLAAEEALGGGLEVISFDMRGHGFSSPAESLGKVLFGPSAAEDEQQFPRLVKDMEEIVPALTKGRPTILLGHSMGSIVSRFALPSMLSSSSIKGLILSSPPSVPGMVEGGAFRAIAYSLAHVLPNWRGMGNKVIRTLLFDSYDKKIRSLRPGECPAWICSDRVQAEKYEVDPMCGFDMDLKFMDSFIGFALNADKPGTWGFSPEQRAAAFPPVLVLGGDDDACTDFGEGPRQIRAGLSQWLCPPSSAVSGQTKTLVKSLEYASPARHELLHEVPEIRKVCIADITSWIKTTLDCTPSKL